MSASRVGRADHLAGDKIGFGDQDIDGGQRRQGRLLRRLRRPSSARQPGSDAAGGKSNTEYDETRGFHYASLPE